MTILEYPDSECSCDYCNSMCQRPCWPTPEEAEKLMNCGFADRLWDDYWVGGENGDIHIIGPAMKGFENKHAPFWPSGIACTFYKDGSCGLHAIELKPIEGRKACCGDHPEQNNFHKEVAMLWDTDKGREVVAKWRKGNK